MRAWILGSGGPYPSWGLRRASSGYLIKMPDSYLLFDHGFGSHQRMLELGVSATDISHIFISHLHYDHIGDLPRLVLTRWNEDESTDLEIYGPPPIARVVKSFFGESGPYGPDLTARTESEVNRHKWTSKGGSGIRPRPTPKVEELSAGIVVEHKDWKMSCAFGNHHSPHLICLAYRLEHNGQSLVYSGDTAPTENIINLATDCDVLIHMCSYITGTEPSAAWRESNSGHLELAKAAAAARPKCLVLTHLGRYDAPGLRERVVSEMSQIYSGKIVLGEDLLEVPFGQQSKAFDW